MNKRKLILDILKPFFIGKGFELNSIENISDSFVRKTDFGLISLNIQFKTQSGYHTFSKVSLSHFEIEKIIIQSGLPNYDFTERLLNSDYSLTTVFDSTTKTSYEIEVTKNSLSVDSNKDAISFAEAVIQYMNTIGYTFSETYSCVQNILAEMDRLEKEDDLWNKILSGGPDYFFRGLIISKLCNDINFNKKIQLVDSIFYDINNGLQNWLPYYEKLKSNIMHYPQIK